MSIVDENTDCKHTQTKICSNKTTKNKKKSFKKKKKKMNKKMKKKRKSNKNWCVIIQCSK